MNFNFNTDIENLSPGYPVLEHSRNEIDLMVNKYFCDFPDSELDKMLSNNVNISMIRDFVETFESMRSLKTNIKNLTENVMKLTNQNLNQHEILQNKKMVLINEYNKFNHVEMAVTAKSQDNDFFSENSIPPFQQLINWYKSQISEIKTKINKFHTEIDAKKIDQVLEEYCNLNKICYQLGWKYEYLNSL
ncbi:hypothetical protein A3Q56_01401 [Intoshia linei]|uniref:Uncharacterized protein n=1 Tax=Intoshia linei TaxID=1819745 RepID=A0A177BBA6_9BILA|nr:hypothetical protein A3Q56_01401 [Intoshia linei]